MKKPKRGLKKPKQPPDIDRLIAGLKSIARNRRSLSVEEIKLIRECIKLLQSLKRKPDKNEGITVFTQVVGILLRIFGSDITDKFDCLM
jgi:hypothetical protein